MTEPQPADPIGDQRSGPAGDTTAADAQVDSIMAWTAQRGPEPVDRATPEQRPERARSEERLNRLDEAHRQLRSLLDDPDA